MSRSQGFEILDHTADVRVASSGSTLEETLTHLLRGVIRLLAGKTQEEWATAGAATAGGEDRNLRTEGAPAKIEREVRVSAPDLERAVVALLNEVIYLYDAEGFEPYSVSWVAADAEQDRMAGAGRPDAGRGRAREGSRVHLAVGLVGTEGRGADSGGYRLSRIKAATYHGIKVSDERIEVVFDT